MRKPFLHLLLLLLLATASLVAQDRPKIGLVLSGGGAKGMAHIGVLKELEALGIRPDYITGTSMGSIVGGLYAAGYSADEIEEIALGMNWSELLSNQVSLDQITYVEKQYYQRYLLELGLVGWSIQLPKGLIDGEKLSELLSNVTRHVHDVDNFDNLPIPFACVGTDIVTGEPVVMRSGSLASALRASMAIPSVFTPVKRDGHFMVDGGLVRNFPVQECLDMGADIIIGVFVSDDLLPEEKLESAVDVLTQSAFVMSVFDSREQKLKCDLLIEPVMDPYTTFSFEGSAEIIKRGAEAAEEVRPRLQILADSLGFTPGYSVTRPAIQDTFRIAGIVVENNENIPEEFVTGRFNLGRDSLLSIHEIEQQVEALYGTRYFNKVIYTLLPEGEKTILKLTLDEATPRQIKVALHYDTENGAGLNLNYTTRDLLPASRALVEVDIAETFRVDANFLKYIKNTQNLALQAGLNYRNGDVPIGDGRQLSATFKNDYLNPYFRFFSTARKNSITGIMLQHEKSVLSPKIAGEDFRDIGEFRWNSWSALISYNHNSLNKQFFPTTGSLLNVEAKYSFGIDYEVTLIDSLGENTLPISPEDFLSISIEQSNRWAISPKLTVGLKNILKMNFLESRNEIASFVPYFNDQIFSGGFRPQLRNSVPFWGSDQITYVTNHLFYNEILFQYEPIANIYIELASQYMNSLYPMKWFYEDADQGIYEFTDGVYSIWGYGMQLSYMSIIGPVSFGVASNTETSSWNTFFSIGFYFR